MTLIELQQLVKKGEGLTVEFKKTTAQLTAIFETICAFLNSKGGIVLIGIADDGKIIGQDVSNNTRQEIANHIAKLEPSAQAQIEIEYIDIEKYKTIITISVLPGNHAPYIYDGRPFLRNQSTTTRMSQHRYEQLIRERGQLNHSWEEFIASDCTIANLDENLVWKVINEGVRVDRLPATSLKENLNQVLANLNLIKDGQLINAAMVMFGKNLFPRYAQCQLKMARFKGIDRHEFLDSDLIYGNIFELLNRGEQFYKKHLPVAAKIVGSNFQRIETPLIPFPAIREALLNALCHSDYRDSSGSISLAIYNDRLELINEGKLLPGITLEKIKRGCSKLRNKIIAGVLYKCKYIEAWGRGIKDIINICRQANIPAPKFKTDDLEFKVTFRFPHSITPKITLSNENIKLSALQKEILEILNTTTALSFKEIAAKLPHKLDIRTLRYEISKLRKLSLVISKGTTKNTVWLLNDLTKI